MTLKVNPAILVTGASGLFGGEVARQLAESGVAIRILLRDQVRVPDFSGHIEIAFGDFSDKDSLTAALDGIERVFLASYDRPEVIEHQANLIAAAKRAGVEHVVRISANGTEEWAHLSIFRQHGICDRQLIESGLQYTLLKPVWIMQNFTSFMMVNDSIRVPAEDGLAGQVDARDVASVATVALTKEGYVGKDYVLCTEALAHGQIAQLLSRSTGRNITYIDLDPETYRKELESSGWTEKSIDSMLGLFDDIRAGTNSDSKMGDTIKPILGRPGIRLQQFAQDYASRI